MKKYIKLMRVHHYIKNILILLPLIFSGQLFATDLVLKTVLGFFSFSLLSSVVYIVNDTKDAKSDRLHSTKKNRPIASGQVKIHSAVILACVLFIISIAVNYFAAGLDIKISLYLILYFVLNLFYSLGLKNIPILDIAILVSGFLLRLLYGAAITDIEISKWLYLTVIAISFYMGLGKRRNEQKQQTGSSRKVLKQYTQSFLDKNMYMCLALAIVFYSLWSVDPITIARIDNTNLVWTVPIVILICMKYSMNIEGDSDGDPVEVILKDKMLLALCVVFALVFLGIFYL
ncbi:MAG: decaprenyl-phosphate phosphoribosyltransferase [Oscillospiraceae bacterium]|jgi:4-hydroxybenzoate polyprenyltransferase|nr:decaprenyl-phosphate phosphoribosyltransferase [Oscillospiraceae bacterium]